MPTRTTIIELEGPVLNVRPRYWAAHRAAMDAIGFEGPEEEEYWRLVRQNAPVGMIVRRAKPDQIETYLKVRNEQLQSTALMELDELTALAQGSLRVLKDRGPCHLVSLCQNREGINATLDRLDIWMYFDRKMMLPEDRPRRIGALKELTAAQSFGPSAGAGQGVAMAVVGTVPIAYAAGEAGCRAVGIRGGPTFPKNLQQVGVDVMFDSLDELTDALATRDPQLQKIGIH